jgi:hypothetical protein
MRRRRRGPERVRCRAKRQRAEPVDRLAHGIDDAAEPAVARADRTGRGRDHGAAAAPHAVERGERHGQRIAAGKADHFARHPRERRFDGQPRADRHGVDRAGDFDHQAAHPDHAAVHFDPVEIVDLLGERFHGAGPEKAGTGFLSGRATSRNTAAVSGNARSRPLRLTEQTVALT